MNINRFNGLNAKLRYDSLCLNEILGTILRPGARAVQRCGVPVRCPGRFAGDGRSNIAPFMQFAGQAGRHAG
jgi:hypothetical protein